MWHYYGRLGICGIIYYQFWVYSEGSFCQILIFAYLMIKLIIAKFETIL